MVSPTDTPPSSRQGLRYSLILGQGRSGTRYLLRLFDKSTDTHCRNEADQIPGSAFARLAPWRFHVDDDAALEGIWDQVVGDASYSIGPRDPYPIRSKTWVYPLTRGLGRTVLRYRYLLRYKITGRDHPMHNGREYHLPRWVVSPRQLETALHVFKLNASCGLAGWMFRQRPAAKAVHIVRHPGGFVKSWRERWLRKNDEGQVQTENIQRLMTLAERDPAWKSRLGDIEQMSGLEAELWFWRFCSEETHRAGEGRQGYHRIIFEDLASDPVAVCRDMYAFVGLPWNRAIEEMILEESRDSKSIAGAWKKELEPDVVEIVERVLDGSPMVGWWAHNEVAC